MGGQHCACADAGYVAGSKCACDPCRSASVLYGRRQQARPAATEPVRLALRSHSTSSSQDPITHRTIVGASVQARAADVLSWVRPRAAAVRSLRMRGVRDADSEPSRQARLMVAAMRMPEPPLERLSDFTGCAPCLGCKVRFC